MLSIRARIEKQGLMDALRKQKTNLQQFTSSGGERGADIVRRVETLSQQARSTVFDPRAKLSQRVVAVRLLARDASTRSEDVQALGKLLRWSG